MTQQILDAFVACPYKAWRLSREDDWPEDHSLSTAGA